MVGNTKQIDYQYPTMVMSSKHFENQLPTLVMRR
jgi:hypothetical protein